MNLNLKCRIKLNITIKFINLILLILLLHILNLDEYFDKLFLSVKKHSAFLFLYAIKPMSF